MSQPITVAELKAALGEDLEALLEGVTAAINQAQPGRIIADSEEPVRDAAAVFRQRLYQMALDLRQQRDAGSFPPSGQSGCDGLAQQGPAGDKPSDGQRAAGGQSGGVLERRGWKRRSGG